MNRIISNFLDIHKSEYSIEGYSPEDAFEHFINRCVVNKYSSDRFDPLDVMTDRGEKGLDGVAICVNGIIITTLEELEAILRDSKTIEVKFVFIQSKTSEHFDGDEIGTFIYGVKAFFANEDLRPQTNPKMENLISLKDKIYEYSVDMQVPPTLDLYYVCCGKWDESNGLQPRIDLDIKPLRDSQDFKEVNFFTYDSEKIITTYKELKKKISRSFPMEKKVVFPKINGVKQAFLGLVKCQDFVKILCDSDNNMLTNIFEDNVRDFQGYNVVNLEIKDTLKNAVDQERFGILNNGITIVAQNINVIGDQLEIYDYQIVNGCQTSYVLFDNRDSLNETSYVMVKLIQVENDEVSDRVIYTTNRQTEVKAEAFIATKHFHKRLQDYYNSIDPVYRLYYERRSKQYDLNDAISKNKVITLTQQIQAYLAMFLNEPHSTHRYYGELLRSYNSKLFLETDDYEPYFCSAYFLYYVEDKLRSGILDKQYKRFKFHLICAMRTLISESTVLFGQAKKQQKLCKKLWAVMANDTEMLRIMQAAVTCLDSACSICCGVSELEQHRSKDITNAMIGFAEEQLKAVSNNSFLKYGDIVHCTVTAIHTSFVDVQIKTDDARNYGSIHISKIARKYIEDLRDEVCIGEIFQAKIISDNFYDNQWGWELTKLF